MAGYDFTALEKKWQDYWQARGTFVQPNPGDEGFDGEKPKLYVLDMFPYPSGAGLHVGHPEGYTATDIVSRYARMKGYNVLHPMGYDAFGLPAEQYAVEHGVHPRETTEQNIANIERQIRMFGFSYDWSRRLATTDADYYRWTQWIFVQMFNSWYDPEADAARPIGELLQRLESGELDVDFGGNIVPSQAVNEWLEILGGAPSRYARWIDLDPDQQRRLIDEVRLAYMAEVPVNWCPQLGTVLANEEVTNEGRSDRGDHPVYRRNLKQWMLRITAYADRLLADIERLDWPESIKIMQRNWIGKSTGAEVDFPLAGLAGEEWFATRRVHTEDGDEGHEIQMGGFPHEPQEEVIRVYTTRPDTLFGATYMVLAPEHPLVAAITTPEQKQAVAAYVHAAANKSELERTAEAKDKTGVFTGAFAVNPVNAEKIPIWVADYVMMGYGTGAIMAVPAHDTRDCEFAEKFDLPRPPVVAYYESEIDKKHFLATVGSPLRLAPFNVTIDVFAADSPVVALRGGRECIQEILAEFKLAGTPVQLVQPELPYVGDGVAVNSGEFDGLPTAEFKTKITEWLEQRGLGKAAVNYKLRDWLFSRQRYWGEPFPIVHGVSSPGTYGVSESDLPVLLPEMDDFSPRRSDDPEARPQPPLGRAGDWKLVCGEFGEAGCVKLRMDLDPSEYVTSDEPDPAKWTNENTLLNLPDGIELFRRELNTMPQWAGSCWYYLRFLDPGNAEAFCDPRIERYWMQPTETNPPGGIDLYVGGAEHAVLHLLYSRFWHKVLYDLGHVSVPEPFGKLFNQGMIRSFAYRDKRGVYLGYDQVDLTGERPVRKETGEEVSESVEKMSKSLKNVVNPDDVIGDYGADTFRLYEMFMGPLEASKPWNTRDVPGVHRFLHRAWRMVAVGDERWEGLTLPFSSYPFPDDELERDDEIEGRLHKLVKKVGEDIEAMKFNTAIAAMMEFVNLVMKQRATYLVSDDGAVVFDRGGRGWITRSQAERFVLVLAPFAPHLAEELWQRLGHEQSLAWEPWPAYDEAMLADDTVELAVQVNGKVRGRITAPADADEDAVLALALADDKVAAVLEGKTVVKRIVVPGRLVSFVVK